MAYDEIKPRGSTKASKPDAGGAVIRSVPLFGIVKDNIDPVRSGRLQVYISDLGSKNPDDSSGWITVSYMSPFYGLTTPSSANTGYGEYIKNPNSYGMWNSQPDIGTTVICIFINGDPNYGYWIGCVPQAEALQMVPAIGGTDNIVANAGEAKGLGGAARLPVTNINTNNEGIANSNKFLTDAKPVHSYVASILAQQGLIRDPIRGVIGSSAQRETPSRVGWGVSTPGRPIYEGGFTDETIAEAAGNSKQQSGLKVVARRGGHTLVMDDGDILGRDQLVRIRSSLGHQILMSDDGQTLFIIHANGQSYIELGKEGTIDMYSTNSFNVLTQGDLNLHADNNININAGKQLNISADTIAISSEKETTQKVGTDFSLYASGKYTTKVDGKMSFASNADASFYSDAITYFNGSKINLNTGASSLVPQEVKPLPITAHTDTLNDATKGWAAAPGKLLSIVSRAPAHAPWASANQGVDVKVNNNASAALPSAPSPAVAAANASAGAPTTPVTVAVASTVPPSAAISAALDKNTTGTMVGQISTLAANGPAAAAVKLGAGTIETANGVVAAVGAMAQSPAQLEAAGVIKPGAAALIDKNINNGMSIAKALTPNLFTGKDGAANLTSYVNNPVAQVATQVATFTQAQTALTQTGLITGKESGTQLAGLVMSAATAGIQNTVNFVSNAASSVVGAVNGAVSNVVGAATGALNTVLGSAASLVSAGNFAGNLASTVTGGLSSIAGALGGMAKGAVAGIAGLLDSAKGVAGSAFAAITGAFPTLQAGVPQNIREITEKAQAAAQAPASNALSSALGAVTGGITGALGAVTSGITGALGAVTGGITGALGAVASVTGSVGSLTGALGAVNSAVASVTGAVNTTIGAATGLIKTTLGATANLSTGLGALPGGASVVASVVNNAIGAINSVPGVSAVTGLIGQASAITNGLSNLSSINPLASSGALNAVAGAAGALTKGLDDLKSGKLTLASLASAGLPTGAAAQLNAAISSMSSGGAVQIKLPTVAINTTDRGELTQSITALLGSAKIPMPNFEGNPATLGKTQSEGSIAQYNKTTEEINTLSDRRFDLQRELNDARGALNKVKTELPAGDPRIASAEATFNSAKQNITNLDKQIQDLRQQIYADSTGNGSMTA